MSDATESAITTAPKKTRRLGRSPAYPSFAIAKALDNAAALYSQEKEYAAPLASALGAFGYGPKSSGGRQALATMKYYGLIDVTGEGDDRRIKVSDAALKILRDPREDDTEKRRLIRDVALAPSAHQTLWGEYPDGLASDGTVLHFLHGQGFNEAAARELLSEFKETASTIALYESCKSAGKSAQKPLSNAVNDSPPTIRVGDKIQWVVNGSDQFADGAVVEAIHASGEWLWVSQDLCKSGIPMSQVELIEAGKGDAFAPPPRPRLETDRVRDEQIPEIGKPKVTIEGDIMTIVASVPMSELSSLKKKIEGLEIFYKS